MNSRSFFFKYKLHHILSWMLLFGTWYYFRYQDYPTQQQAFWITLLKVADLAMMIYLANYLLIPRLLYKKKYAWFLVTFIVMIVSSSLGKMLIIGRILDDPSMFDLTVDPKQRIYDNVIPHFFLVIAGVAFKLIYDHFRMQKRLVEMAREKAEAELSFLKSQINPHFLFNSLNSVYFLINKENPEARQALHKFSDMLRYQLYEVKGTKIPIEKELSYLKDYVDLQKLRKDENYSVEFNCSPDVKGFSIEPLLLIPFVENAFKHISHKAGEKNFVKLDMTRHNGQFSFMIENSKEPGHTTEQHGGIGLNNVRRRLELLYPEKHVLQIKEEDNHYKVDLKLKIEQQAAADKKNNNLTGRR
ncbi:MAG: histidine kinase [Bacteroidota bacterium]|nr:histidine kinase [Bacteroidota bacterium]